MEAEQNKIIAYSDNRQKDSGENIPGTPAGPDNDPEKNDPFKKDGDNDPTRIQPGVTDPGKNDPARIPADPQKVNPPAQPVTEPQPQNPSSEKSGTIQGTRFLF